MNEPVAFVDKIWIERPDLVMSQQLDIGRLFMRYAKEIKNYIPLYAHPQRELTDEDYKIIMLQWDYWRKQIANGDTSSSPRDWFEGVIYDLLKADLEVKKASEK